MPPCEAGMRSFQEARGLRAVQALASYICVLTGCSVLLRKVYMMLCEASTHCKKKREGPRIRECMMVS